MVDKMGDMMDRLARVINPRAFGPLDGNYFFKSWQDDDKAKAYAAAEAVLRELRDGPTYDVLNMGYKAMVSSDYIDDFDRYREAWSASLNAALRLSQRT